MTKEQLCSILKEPKNALVKQFAYLFGLDKIGLEFTDEAVEAIATKAKELKTNARGLKNIMENILLEYQYNATELQEKGLESLTITKDTVVKNAEPVLIYKKKTETNGKKH